VGAAGVATLADRRLVEVGASAPSWSCGLAIDRRFDAIADRLGLRAIG
jgi:hypothetical protein